MLRVSKKNFYTIFKKTLKSIIDWFWISGKEKNEKKNVKVENERGNDGCRVKRVFNQI